MSQTGSPILPVGVSQISSRPSVKRYQPAHTMAVLPQLPKTNFELIHSPGPIATPSYNFPNMNKTPVPFNDRQMASQIQSSLKRAANAHHHVSVPPSSYPAYNLAQSYQHAPFSPVNHSKPAMFGFENDQTNVPGWRDSLRKTGYNIYEDQQQPSSNSFQSGPSFRNSQPQQAKGPKVVNLQYNSPIGLYSKQNIDEELHKKIGFVYFIYYNSFICK